MSKGLIAGDDLEREVATIVEKSCWRNEARGVTGALIASPHHFAQYMEGPTSAVAVLMDRIAHDDRHTHTHVVDSGDRADRLFPHWSMAYAGTSVFVERSLAGLFAWRVEDRVERVAQVLSLMREFARPYRPT